MYTDPAVALPLYDDEDPLDDVGTKEEEEEKVGGGGGA